MTEEHYDEEFDVILKGLEMAEDSPTKGLCVEMMGLVELDVQVFKEVDPRRFVHYTRYGALVEGRGVIPTNRAQRRAMAHHKRRAK